MCKKVVCSVKSVNTSFWTEVRVQIRQVRVSPMCLRDRKGSVVAGTEGVGVESGLCLRGYEYQLEEPEQDVQAPVMILTVTSAAMGGQ